mgnify:CR=1 FL=1
MNFNQLDEEQKKQLHTKAIDLAENLGGVNFFLQMIEISTLIYIYLPIKMMNHMNKY